MRTTLIVKKHEGLRQLEVRTHDLVNVDVDVECVCVFFVQWP